MQRLLIIEDNAQYAESLKASVQDQFDIEICSSVQNALRLLHSKPYDVLLCDYVLGDANGLDIVEHVKDLSSAPRVVLMTAFAEKEMAIKALNLGVSHFLQKPFSVKELRSVLHGNRVEEAKSEITTVFCPVTNTVTWNGSAIKLTPSEYLILSCLVSQKNKWVSRDQVEKMLWDENPHISRNILDTHIYNLKKKVPALSERLSIIRGKGFFLDFN